MQVQIIPLLILIAVVGSLTYMIVSIITLKKKRRKVFARCTAQYPSWEWMGGMRSSVNRLEKQIVSEPDQMSEKRKKRAERDDEIERVRKILKRKYICDYLDTTDTLFSLFRNSFRRLGERTFNAG